MIARASDCQDSSCFTTKIDLDAVVEQEIINAQKRGIPLKAVAADAGIPGWRMYEIHERRKRLFFAEAPRVMSAIGSDVLLDALAATRGAIVFHVRPVTRTPADLSAAFAEVARELGNVARTQLELVAHPPPLTGSQPANLVRHLDALIAAAESMKHLALRKSSPMAGLKTDQPR